MSDNKPRVGNITQLTQSNDRLRHDLREAEAALKLGVRRNIQRVRDQQKGVPGLAENLSRSQASSLRTRRCCVRWWRLLTRICRLSVG